MSHTELLEERAEAIRELWLDPHDPPPGTPARRCEGCYRVPSRLHGSLCDRCLPRPEDGQLPQSCECGARARDHSAWCDMEYLSELTVGSESVELRRCGCGRVRALRVDVTRAAGWRLPPRRVWPQTHTARPTTT